MDARLKVKIKNQLQIIIKDVKSFEFPKKLNRLATDNISSHIICIFKIRGKEVIINDIQKVPWYKKGTGLMFKPKESNALLFEFGKKAREAITSVFCRPFLAIWLSDGKIVDFKFVASWKLSIKPKKDFDRLIEIPLNNKYSHVIKLFLDEKLC